MRSSTGFKRLVAACVLVPLLLGGCVTTVFESPPGERTSACDARWVGSWELHPVDATIREEDRIVLTMDAGCSALHIAENGKPQHELDHAIVVFAEVEKMSILALKLRAKPTKPDPNAIDWNNGYHYFSYEVGTDEIRVRQVDDELVARLIADDQLSGRSEKITRYPGAHKRSDGRNLQNFVAGSTQDMAQALAAHALFFDKGAITLKRNNAAPVKPETGDSAAAKKASPP